MRYSLANYYLTIANDDSRITEMFKDVRIGGEGDAISSISISTNATLWQTTAYATGAWVHDKNLARNGNVNVSISQLTDAVAKFKQFVNYFYLSSGDSDIQGSTITLYDSDGNAIASCEDCYPTQIPEQSFGAQASEQTWSFTCGRITFL